MSNFLPFFQEESQAIRDERKDHGAVDESSSEQQIHESADYTLIVRKTGALHLVLPGLTAGRPAVCETKSSKHSKFLKFSREQTWKH